jgi:hypothetical protein
MRATLVTRLRLRNYSKISKVAKLPFDNYPSPFGLYNAKEERDACGVGFVADLSGEDLFHAVN